MWSEEIQHKLDEIVVKKGLPQDSYRKKEVISELPEKLLLNLSNTRFE